MSRFIHLHNHTEYSLSSGTIKLKKLIEYAKKFNMPSVAMTDSENMFGALEFSIAASKEGIQPIIGGEFNIIFDGFFKRKWEDHFNTEHLTKIVLLAQTDEGFKNLISLASDYYLYRGITTKNEEGKLDKSLSRTADYEYSSPRLNFEWLKDRNKGIICLTCGVDGMVGRLLKMGDRERAEKVLLDLKEIFGDRLYIELQRHGLQTEIDLEPHFIEFALKHNIPLVATNDCYFLTRDTHKAQDVLSCVASGRLLIEKNRKKQTGEHYFKTEEEMCELFADIPEAIENTVNIAKRIATMSYKRKPTFPNFPLPNNVSEVDFIKKETEDGLNERLKQKFINENVPAETQEGIKKQYFDRLSYEIDIINKMGFPSYFLVVSDFVKWSKNNDVPIGPGRGSGAGSVVAWSLKITDIDPIKFDISFERFLNPERVSMPDFDIDFCERGRGRSIEYVQNKYGKELVGRIITFNKLQARGAIKDVGRVLGINYQETDRLTKTIPQDKDLAVSIKEDPSIEQQMQSDQQVNEIISIALELEGLNRNTGLHAAGIVIGDKPLEQICPLYSDGKTDIPAVQYSMKYAEEVGLVKFDFLGLSTLTVIRDTLLYLKRRNIEIDINNIPYDDEPTFKMLARADTLGVFQIESAGMKSVLVQMKPDRITDITALVALYRPGPMDSIPHYIKRKNGTEDIECLHPKMLDVLSDSYGIIVYQDQVMNLARELAGYSMGGADLLRRAMGKKIQVEMDAQREIFINGGKVKTKILGNEVEVEIPGAVKQSNINSETASKIFNDMAQFASYGFNLAHATAYGIIAYQTAYLRCHFPAEFYAASMNDSISNTSRIGAFIQDLRKHKIEILMPDINLSTELFNVESIKNNEEYDRKSNEINILDIHVKEDLNGTDNVITSYNDFTEQDNKNYSVRFALSAIKGIGSNVAEAIIEERKKNGKFKDLWNFIDRMDAKFINKKSIEALAKAGVLDSIHNNRRQIHDSFQTITEYKGIEVDNGDNKQSSFLDMLGSNSRPTLPNVNDWEGEERYQKEFEVYGFFISGHPLDDLSEELESKGITFLDELENLKDGDKIRVAGIIISTMIKSSPKGKYAFISIADSKGMFEVTLYKTDLIMMNKDLIAEKNHNKVVFECSVRKNETEGNTEIRLSVQNLFALETFLNATTAGQLEKVEHRKEWTKSNGGGGSPWRKDENGKWYKIDGEKKYDIKNDPIMVKKQDVQVNTDDNARKIYKQITIFVNKKSACADIKLILDSCRRDFIKDGTRVILDINGLTKLDLGVSFYMGDIEKRRIENINGVMKIETI